MISEDRAMPLAETTFSSVHHHLDELMEVVVDPQNARIMFEEERKKPEHSMPEDHDDGNRAYDALKDNRTDI
jgi:DNA helicase IV